jgi:hypothetical protein
MGGEDAEEDEEAEDAEKPEANDEAWCVDLPK